MLRRRSEAAALPQALIEVLLTGDSRIDPFLIFELGPRDIDDHWRQHGDALRAEAKRLGIQVPKGREQ
jgi:hypothetical protein